MSRPNLTLEDILKLAIKVEVESNLFYTYAIGVVDDSAVAELLIALQLEEAKHENRLTKIIEMSLDKSIMAFAGDPFNNLVQTRSISSNSSVKEVLEVALEREKSTCDFYGKIANILDIDKEVAEIFNMLHEQETGHIHRISKMLDVFDK